MMWTSWSWGDYAANHTLFTRLSYQKGVVVTLRIYLSDLQWLSIQLLSPEIITTSPNSQGLLIAVSARDKDTKTVPFPGVTEDLWPSGRYLWLRAADGLAELSWEGHGHPRYFLPFFSLLSLSLLLKGLTGMCYKGSPSPSWLSLHFILVFPPKNFLACLSHSGICFWDVWDKHGSHGISEKNHIISNCIEADRPSATLQVSKPRPYSLDYVITTSFHRVLCDLGHNCRTEFFWVNTLLITKNNLSGSCVYKYSPEMCLTDLFSSILLRIQIWSKIQSLLNNYKTPSLEFKLMEALMWCGTY